MGYGMFLKVGAGTSVSSVNMEQAREMTGLDLVLETEPSITNKVKVGAELTFITGSHIY